MPDDNLIFEALCIEMEKNLGRALTPSERSAMRMSHAAVKPTPFVVERRTGEPEENTGKETDAAASGE